jgi:FkbM family methyltransferase
MSRRYAKVITALVRALARPLPFWLRVNTLARHAEAITPRPKVSTPRGVLSFFTPSKSAVFWPRFAYSAEPETLAWIDTIPAGSVLWDIGASVGAYAMYAALRGDVTVLAFEPNPYTFHCLVRNLHENRLDQRVSAYCIALAQAPELGAFYIRSVEAGTTGNTFGDPKASVVGGLSAELSVATLALSIDSLCNLLSAPFPTHIKIDVDSIEDSIVAGGVGVLADPRLRAVLVEVFPGDAKQVAERVAMAATLRRCGLAPAPLPQAHADSPNRLFVRPDNAG